MVAMAVIIAPAGHFWAPVWWAVAAVFALVGTVLYVSERVAQREHRDRQDPSANAGEIPGPGPLNPGGIRRGSSGGDDIGGDFDGD
jgi:hypothetical protein